MKRFKRIQMLLILLLVLASYYVWSTAKTGQQGFHLKIPRLIQKPSLTESAVKPTPSTSLPELILRYELGKTDPFQPGFASPARPVFLSSRPRAVYSPHRQTPAKPNPSLTLKAILTGEPPMALIQQDKEEQVVKAGDTLGPYHVSAIHEETVILTSREGNTILTLTQEADE